MPSEPPAAHVERRLATILVADVPRYSRLIGENEERRLHTLRGHRALFDDVLKAHRGRVFNTAGDAILAEFPSAVEAVRCATEVQAALRTRNEHLPEAERLWFASASTWATSWCRTATSWATVSTSLRASNPSPSRAVYASRAKGSVSSEGEVTLTLELPDGEGKTMTGQMSGHVVDEVVTLSGTWADGTASNATLARHPTGNRSRPGKRVLIPRSSSAMTPPHGGRLTGILRLSPYFANRFPICYCARPTFAP